MPTPQKLRKWHFLFLGGVLILLAFFLWYWNWRLIGLPNPIQPEHFITIVSFIVGLLILCVFIYRLTRRQVTIMLVGMVVVNLVAALVTEWIFTTYPALFSLMRPIGIEAYDPVYVQNWRDWFLTPAVYANHIGLLILWVMSLVMFLVRKPTDQPE